MNTLSIFLYLANVIPNLGTFFTAAGFVVLVAFSFLIIGVAIDNDAKSYRIERGDIEAKRYKPIFKWIWVPILSVIIGLLIPSERTMYMIAASELGEIAVMNEEVQEVFDALKERILIELRPQENTNN